MLRQSNPYEFPLPQDNTVEARQPINPETERITVSRKIFFQLVLALGVFIGISVTLSVMVIVLLTKGM